MKIKFIFLSLLTVFNIYCAEQSPYEVGQEIYVKNSSNKVIQVGLRYRKRYTHTLCGDYYTHLEPNESATIELWHLNDEVEFIVFSERSEVTLGSKSIEGLMQIGQGYEYINQETLNYFHND